MSGRRAELFRSDNLRVRQVGGFGKDRLVVTFLPFNEAGRREEHGFGELFFEKRGVDAIHVVPADNAWYQYPELPEAAALVRSVAAGYRKVVTYGSSMGGYGAIRFGGLVGASDAIALSPQFSIDRRIAPFEDRWPGEAANIDYILERRLAPPFVDRAFVAYDPRSIDRPHVELYRATTRLVDIRLLNTGHLGTWILSDLGMLERLVFDVLADRLEPERFAREVHAQRRRSSWFFVALAEKCGNPQRRVSLARHACQMAPAEPVHLLIYATALVALGDLAPAVQALNRAYSVVPGSAQMRQYLSHVLELAGDFEGAATLLRALIAEQPVLGAACQAKADELAAQHAAEQAWRAALRERLARAIAVDAAARRPLHAGAAGRFARRLARGIPLRRGRQAGARSVATAHSATTPARPACPDAWRDVAPGDIVDVALIGDGVLQPWDRRFWAPFRVRNLACPGDATEHVLWRLDRLRRPLAARVVVVAAGTVNLRRGDQAGDIAEGVRAIGRRLRAAAPAAWRVALELRAEPGADPRADPRADAERESERARVNAALRDEPLFMTVATDRFAEWLAAAVSADDASPATVVRPREQAYRILTRIVLDRLDAALPYPDAATDAA